MNPAKASTSGPRIERERKTVSAMITLYCRGNHRSRDAICPACFELLEYAHFRLLKCPYGERKPACDDCSTHCYTPSMRERIKEVMRYSGPWMLLWHPILAVRHYLDGKRRGS